MAQTIRASAGALFNRGATLLTEAEVQRTFRQILKKSDNNTEALDRAEAMLDELRPESPLRCHLFGQLEELRKLAAAKRQA